MLRRGRSSRGAADERRLAAGVEHLGEGAVGEDDAALGIERGDAVGDGFEHRFELAAARFSVAFARRAARLESRRARAAVSRSAAMCVEAAASSPSSSVALSPTRWA